jgi:hypothetical protein
LIPVRDLDLFFLSYDEPAADAHFADLCRKHPAARRIHGIEGFDRAHKAAARASRTDHFITVDADNIVDPAFFELAIDRAHLGPRTIVSWPAINATNGLVFGNGAIKCWPRRYVLEMRTHEIATGDEAAVDFIYNTDLGRSDGPFHLEEPTPMSTVHADATPLQAFRAGFRAASRLTLRNGRPCLVWPGADAIVPMNRHRLALWLNVGADAKNGLWTIYGARLGVRLINYDGLALRTMNDLDWFERYFRDEIAPRFGLAEGAPGFDLAALEAATAVLGADLAERSGLALATLTPAQSALFKRLYVPPPLSSLDRLGNMFRNGVGVPKDPARAARYYAAAAGHGERNGSNNLGRLFAIGSGVRRDYRRAVALLGEATAAGQPHAQERLAAMHERGFGWGIDQDDARARELFEAAVDGGVWSAGEATAALARKAADAAAARGDDPLPDLRRALLYLTFAAMANPTKAASVRRLRAALRQAGG